MAGNSACQSCGSRDLRVFYESMDITVHSCLMVDSIDDARTFPRGDLQLYFCRACGFIQNGLFDPAKMHYSGSYEETQAFSPRFMTFLNRLAEEQVQRYALTGKTVMEVGCGKGEFLLRLCELGAGRGIGFDPSYAPERVDSAAGDRVEVIRELYPVADRQYAADYVCCRHTLEHIQPVRSFVSGIADTLSPDNVVMFELPDMERILKECAFWDIYYEHVSYFTRGSLGRLFRSLGFELLDLYKDYDDQYLVIEGLRTGKVNNALLKVEEPLAELDALVDDFETSIAKTIAGLRAQLDDAVARGWNVAIWGSGSKAVSYISTLKITDEVRNVIDVNPHKNGKYMAGSTHLIELPEALRRSRPELVVIMNPIYRDEIRQALNAMDMDPILFALGADSPFRNLADPPASHGSADLRCRRR
jgi:SAM-dependent methyltransferase